MKNNHYESPIVAFLMVKEDVLVASSVIDGGDRGIGYESLFGEEGELLWETL